MSLIQNPRQVQQGSIYQKTQDVQYGLESIQHYFQKFININNYSMSLLEKLERLAKEKDQDKFTFLHSYFNRQNDIMSSKLQAGNPGHSIELFESNHLIICEFDQHFISQATKQGSSLQYLNIIGRLLNMQAVQIDEFNIPDQDPQISFYSAHEKENKESLSFVISPVAISKNQRGKLDISFKDMLTFLALRPKPQSAQQEAEVFNKSYVSNKFVSADLKIKAQLPFFIKTLKDGKRHFREYVGLQLEENDENFRVRFKENLRRWSIQNHSFNKQKQQSQELEKSSRYVVRQYADFKSAAILTDLLQRIPNFRIKLTDEEKSIISQDGDVIVVGRSGTGKTTCSILRLFSMDMLFKLRLNILYNKQQGFLDLLNSSGEVSLRNVFVTVSPVLAYEVRKYYKSLVEYLQEQVNKKRKDAPQTTRVRSAVSLEQRAAQFLSGLRRENEENCAEQEKEATQDEGEQEVDDFELEEFEKKMGMYTSLIEINEFPVFLTLRKLIQLIDAGIKQPFFSSFHSKGGPGPSQWEAWHNERGGQLTLNSTQQQASENYDNEEYMQKAGFRASKKSQPCSQQKEVNFEVFNSCFWKEIYASMVDKAQSSAQVKLVKKLDAAFIWNEIYRKIKGGRAHVGQHISKASYINQFPAGDSSPEAVVIYAAYERYQALLKERNCYDMMDIVNHILQQIEQNGFNFPPVHYLVIDEMQDLPKSMIFLLTKITERGIYMSGDSAQNIIQGAGLTASQIGEILETRSVQGKQKPQVSIHCLSNNFRSHKRILWVANSIVQILEILPNSIERFTKEFSLIDGPTPILLGSKDPVVLFDFLSEQKESSKEAQIEFGCSQVIIVKNQEMKDTVPAILKHNLVLTIYESKGLEFDDVVLFNFFSPMATNKLSWRVLRNIKVTQKVCPKQEYETQVELKKLKDVVVAREDPSNPNYMILMELKLEEGKQKQEKSTDSQNMLMELQSELKLLYVAVTRPKRRLIIYDIDDSIRQMLEKIWNQLKIVHIVPVDTRQTELGAGLGQFFPQTTQTTPKAQWHQRGVLMMRKGFYDQAAKCFDLSGHAELRMKAEAYILATEAAQLESDNQGQPKKPSHLDGTAREKFLRAAEIFCKLRLHRRAAQCYFSGHDFKKALWLYELLGMLEEQAECALRLENSKKASHLLFEVGDIERGLDLLLQKGQYLHMIKRLDQHRGKLDQTLVQTFLSQAFPKVLEILTKRVEAGQDEQAISEESADEIEDNSIQFKMLMQQSEEDESRDEETELELEAIMDDKGEASNQRVPLDMGSQMNKTSYNAKENNALSLDIEKSSKGLKKNEKEPKTLAFAVEKSQPDKDISICGSDSGHIFAERNNPAFAQTQSQSQSDKYRLLSQIFSKNLKSNLDQYVPERFVPALQISPQTNTMRTPDFKHYSALLNSPLVSIQPIYPQKNIEPSDGVIQELLNCCSIYSEEFRNHVYNQSVETLGIETILMMLDILETQMAFKLCIYICNKFNLAYKLGRYLVSIVLGHSPQIKNNIKPTLQVVTDSTSKRHAANQAITASMAIHSTLETVNPNFIRPKFQNEQVTPFNTLDQKSLKMMIALGFWKKVLYQLDYRNALELCELHFDWEHWRHLYFQNQVATTIDEALKEKHLIQLKNSKASYFDSMDFPRPSSQEEFELSSVCFCDFMFDLVNRLSVDLKFVNLIHLERPAPKQQARFLKWLEEAQVHELFQLSVRLASALGNERYLDDFCLEQLVVRRKHRGIENYTEKLLYYEASLWAQILVLQMTNQQVCYARQLSDQEPEVLHSILDYLPDICSPDKLGKLSLAIIFKVSFSTSRLLSFQSSFTVVHVSTPLLQSCLRSNSESIEFFDVEHDFLLVPKDVVAQEVLALRKHNLKQLMTYRISELRKRIDVSYQMNMKNCHLLLASVLTLQLLLEQLSERICLHADRKAVLSFGSIFRANGNKIGLKWLASKNAQEIDFKQIFGQLLLRTSYRYPAPLPEAIRKQLTNLGFQCFWQALNHQSRTEWFPYAFFGIHLMNFCDQNQHSLLYSNCLQEKMDNYASLRTYIESLEFRQLGCSHETVKCLLSHYSDSLEFMTFKDRLRIMRHVFIFLLVASKETTSQKLFVPNSLIKYFPDLKRENEGQFTSKIPIEIMSVENCGAHFDEALSNLLQIKPKRRVKLYLTSKSTTSESFRKLESKIITILIWVFMNRKVMTENHRRELKSFASICSSVSEHQSVVEQLIKICSDSAVDKISKLTALNIWLSQGVQMVVMKIENQLERVDGLQAEVKKRLSFYDEQNQATKNVTLMLQKSKDLFKRANLSAALKSLPFQILNPGQMEEIKLQRKINQEYLRRILKPNTYIAIFNHLHELSNQRQQNQNLLEEIDTKIKLMITKDSEKEQDQNIKLNQNKELLRMKWANVKSGIKLSNPVKVQKSKFQDDRRTN